MKLRINHHQQKKEIPIVHTLSSDANFYGKDVPFKNRILSILLDIGLAI